MLNNGCSIVQGYSFILFKGKNHNRKLDLISANEFCEYTLDIVSKQSKKIRRKKRKKEKIVCGRERERE